MVGGEVVIAGFVAERLEYGGEIAGGVGGDVQQAARAADEWKGVPLVLPGRPLGPPADVPVIDERAEGAEVGS